MEGVWRVCVLSCVEGVLGCVESVLRVCGGSVEGVCAWSCADIKQG